MLCRSFVFAGWLLLSGCAQDAGYHQSGYASQHGSRAGDYPPAYQDPLIGGVYAGDGYDPYGSPVFTPYQGIRCDRRRNLCWSQNGLDYDWAYRVFSHARLMNGNWEHGNWMHGGNGRWNDGRWRYGNKRPPGWNYGGHHVGRPGGAFPGGNPNGNAPWVYHVPLEPDGSGAPGYAPNGCGGTLQPAC